MHEHHDPPPPVYPARPSGTRRRHRYHNDEHGDSAHGVAARLDTSASALYRYVDHRSDLLDLMADHVVAELRPSPAPGSTWLEPMIELAAGQRSLHERHPWLTALGYRSSGLGPESLAYFDACLGILTPVRAPTQMKFEAIALVTGLAALFAQQAANAQSDGASAFPGVDFQAYPHLASALTQPMASPGHEDLFDHTIRSMLRGLLALDDTL